tara:strand:- start:224 stop:1141 length:918 start_codon:yes stop_codon:yes gene_type:complete
MLIKNVFIKRHRSHAGKWIYEGYRAAWESLGYSAHYYDDLAEISSFKERYYLMAIDGDVRGGRALSVVESAQKTFLYVQPNWFPEPWGLHPNFQCHCPSESIESLNRMNNVFLWSFGGDSKYHDKWKDVAPVPLAFDSNSYVPVVDDNIKFDVCFVGGWANNGFDEKRKIMLEYFKEFKDSGLKCGFFINKGLTHEQENAILYNSKVTINIHDAYQRALGLDTNERTFKSLGTNGILVSDNIKQIRNLNLGVSIAESSKDMVDAVRVLTQEIDSNVLESMRQDNKKNILKNHTYIERVKTMLSLK